MLQKKTAFSDFAKKEVKNATSAVVTHRVVKSFGSERKEMTFSFKTIACSCESNLTPRLYFIVSTIEIERTFCYYYF